jgi:hypothetical protein
MTNAAHTTSDAAADRRRANPWEPPIAGTEVGHLLGSLDRLRTTFRWKADGLDAAGLQARVGASALTLGNLLKHLALVEDYYANVKLRGDSIGLPWTEIHDQSDEYEFRTAVDDSPEQLYAFWDDAVERSHQRVAAGLAEGGLDLQAHVSSPEGEHATLRRLLFDLVEEYGRHTGHADLIREAVDGRVGEDPPDGWRPVSGRFVPPMEVG